MICLGLIGLGQAAQILHIPNIEKMENKFEITAVADISKNLTNYIADKYRVPHRFTDGMDLIGCPDVDAVMVMSPGDHAEFAIAALEAGKHVFIEKPMTSSLESLEKLLEVKRRHPDQIAMVGYCRRYNDSFMKMKELLQADSRPISYVRARTIILEGPWYLDNTWHEHKADDLDPAGRELMNRRMFEEIDRVLGGNTSHAQQMAYLLMTASGCHILSAIREVISDSLQEGAKIFFCIPVRKKSFKASVPPGYWRYFPFTVRLMVDTLRSSSSAVCCIVIGLTGLPDRKKSS